ncbi:MmgE/PrpD family protein 4 (plasmid) [Rhizobium sp. ACO-34A]|nr:MmgE/PrpD family protein [Rhizobium sp. ACO-34A]ATN37399.1 MmgE/PrpD family protein 4 [Rhizobium sp. ACO-34A]
MTEMTISEHLAAFVCGLDRRSIPANVWQKAQNCLLNGYGIALAGLGTPYEPVARAAARAMYGPAAESTLLGSGEKGPAAAAILANGALFHGRGQEDSCGAAHLGAVLIPLLAALIESGRANASEFIPALVAGYEVGGLFEELLAVDTTPAGFRATTIYGAGAAAAAVARLYGLSPGQTAAALGNAVSFSGGLLQTFAEGTDEWRYQVGATAQAGWTSAELAKAGSVSIREPYEGPKGLARAFAGRSLGVGEAVEKIGRNWQTLRVAFKPFPVCAFNQTPVTSALRLRQMIAGRPIASVAVRMNPYECGYAGMDSKGPFSTISGTLMSIPFCIASTLLRGAPSMKMMTVYDDAEISSLVEKIDLIAEPSVAVLSCRIDVTLAEGRTVSDECVMTPSDYAYDFEELVRRLRATVAQEGLPEESVDILAGYCAAPETTPMSNLFRAFALARAGLKQRKSA